MKRILLLLGALLLLMVSGLGIFMASIDFSALQNRLIEQVRAQTGRELSVKGPVSWRWYPSLGLQVNDLTLGNAPGFDPTPMLQVAQADVGLGLMALLSGRLELEQIRLMAPRILLQRRADGKTNLDDLLFTSQTTQVPDAQTGAAPASTAPQITSWSVAGIDVQGGELTIVRPDGPPLRLTRLDFHTTEISEPLHSAVTMKAQLDVGAQQIQLETSADVSRQQDRFLFNNWQLATILQLDAVPVPVRNIKAAGRLELDIQQHKVLLDTLTATMGPLALTGKLDVQWAPVLRIDSSFQTPLLDVAWLAPPSPTGSKASRNNKAISNQEPDLRGLPELFWHHRWQIGEIKHEAMQLTGVSWESSLEKQLFTLQRLEIDKVFGGRMSVSGQSNFATYPLVWRLKPDLHRLQIQPLMLMALGKAPLSGLASASGELSGLGVLSTSLRRHTQGTLWVTVDDGAMQGINLAAMLRDAKAKLKGKTQPHTVKRTDFSALRLDMMLTPGLARFSKIKMASPLFRISGQGLTQLERETLDIDLDVAVVATSKGQGGAELADLYNLTIPVQIIGTWSQPDYRVQLGSLLKLDNIKQLPGKVGKGLESGIGKLFH